MRKVTEQSEKKNNKNYQETFLCCSAVKRVNEQCSLNILLGFCIMSLILYFFFFRQKTHEAGWNIARRKINDNFITHQSEKNTFFSFSDSMCMHSRCAYKLKTFDMGILVSIFYIHETC